MCIGFALSGAFAICAINCFNDYKEHHRKYEPEQRRELRKEKNLFLEDIDRDRDKNKKFLIYPRQII